MKKETLEDAAKNKYPIENTGAMFMPNLHEVSNIFRQEVFIEGAKWQAERMYSEEELKSLIIKALTHNDYDLCGSLATRDWEIRTANFEVWFEHNKK